MPFWLLPGMILVAAWLLFALAMFGSPIPQSAWAKLVADRIPFLMGFVFYLFRFISENIAFLIVLLFSCLGAWILLRSKDEYKNYAVVLIFSLVYAIVVAFIAGSFPWYYAPLIPGLSIISGIGITCFSRSLAEWFEKRDDRKIIDFRTLLPSALVISLAAGQMLSWGSNYAIYHGAYYDNRYTTYREVSDWLIANTSKSQSIALLEIGFIGYLTEMEVVDLYGLITPALFPWVDDGTEQTLIQSIQLYQPDFVLMPSSKTAESNFLAEHPLYRVANTFHGYYLFERIQP